MKYLIAILAFIFLVIVVYQIACEFPLISKNREKIRQKRWAARQKTKKENEEKIKLLDKKLKGNDEIKMYVTLNRFNLPEDEKWETLLPKMIKDLLAIGWTTEMPINTKFKYGSYEIHIATSNQDIINSSTPIFYKYLDQYEQMWIE